MSLFSFLILLMLLFAYQIIQIKCLNFEELERLAQASGQQPDFVVDAYGRVKGIKDGQAGEFENGPSVTCRLDRRGIEDDRVTMRKRTSVSSQDGLTVLKEIS